MNDANKETNAAYEEPKKKVYVKLIIFLALITALFIVLGAKFVTFYYKTHGIGGHYFYLLGVQNIDDKNCKVYLLSDCGHYKDSVLQSGSLVVKMIDFEKQKGQWAGDYLWEPRGGAMYEGSIRETIPSELADLIFSDEETEIKKTITDETEEKVKAYYDTDEVA